MDIGRNNNMASGRRYYSGPINNTTGGGLSWKGRHNSDEDPGDDELGRTKATVSDTEAIYRLSEHVKNTLSVENEGISPPAASHRREESMHSDNRSETSVEDRFDAASSDWGPAYQGSSDEGIRGQSKRTLKSNRIRKPALERTKEEQAFDNNTGFRPPGGYGRDISDVSSSIPSWSSNLTGSGSIDPIAVSNWAGSEDASSGFTSSSGQIGYRGAQPNHVQVGSNLTEADFDMSKRMDDIRDQRLRTQFMNMDARGSSTGSNRNQNRSSGVETGSYQTDHCCLHCRTEVCGAFMQFPPVNCCDNGQCRSCSHCCCRPYAISVTRCHSEPRSLSRVHGRVGLENSNSNPRNEHQVRKRLIWPVFGGTSFIECYECSMLIRMPENFHFYRDRRNKMRCGGCQEVLAFELANGSRITRSVKGREEPGNVDAGTPTWGERGDNESSRRSGNEDFGSSEYETDSSSGRKGKKKGPAVLHKLMGYWSARDVMYGNNGGSSS